MTEPDEAARITAVDDGPGLDAVPVLVVLGARGVERRALPRQPG